MYVTTCTRLKRALHFIVVVINVQDNGAMKNTPKDGLPDPRGSLANDIPSHAIEQPNQEF